MFQHSDESTGLFNTALVGFCVLLTSPSSQLFPTSLRIAALAKYFF